MTLFVLLALLTFAIAILDIFFKKKKEKKDYWLIGLCAAVCIGSIIKECSDQNKTDSPKNEQRKLTQSELNELLQVVPKDYLIDITAPANDNEGTILAQEIADKLKEHGYRIKTIAFGFLVNPKTKYGLNVNHEEKIAYIEVYPQLK